MANFFITQITVLQQEGYVFSRFFRWWLSHPLTSSLSAKKGLVKTSKIKLLIKLCIFYLLLLNLAILLSKHYLFLLPLNALLYFFPFPLLFLSLFSLLPYEMINRFLTVKRIRSIIASHPHLSVIGITGSYGKTSVKDYLHTILKVHSPTVKTPESYNTVFGIAKVVDLEIISRTKFFICEMGAYVRGEIKELTNMVPPHFAILTAIGNQHLERFKTISNTTLAKFELIDSVAPNHALVNLDNPHIKQHLSKPQYHSVLTYSLLNPHATFYTKVTSYTSDRKTIFTITYQNKIYRFTSSLFGTSNLYNLTAAISMAFLLQVPYKVIQSQVALIKPSPHRLELKKIGKAILIDNAFSSNEAGFTSLIQDLSGIKGKKVLITPGIIELGKDTSSVHQKIGQLCSSVFDTIILVGHSDRTRSLEQGVVSSLRAQHSSAKPRLTVGGKNPYKFSVIASVIARQSHTTPTVSYIPNSTNLWPLVEKLAQEYDWILIENDLPDNF